MPTSGTSVSRSASINATGGPMGGRGGGGSVGGSKYASLPGHAAPSNGAGRTPTPGPRPALDSTAFSPEELASQLTLLDLPVFCSIASEELMSCAWNKKHKMEVAPHVVAFIRRFNHVSFWSTQEILGLDTPKARAEVMVHFIRTAKKLHELNNLNSEFAILSSLQSASIYRLSKTWSHLSRKDRQTFDKLADLFSERDNFARLRDHMNGIALKHDPCIPYLGLYLTDLVYIDMAHPHSGGLESQPRQFKMNNVLRIVSELQQSNYATVFVIPKCQQYLRSIQYIDELQKFIEEDHYKLSLKLEPNIVAQSVPSSASSKESVHSSRDPALMAELNLSPAKGHCGMRPAKPAFVPGHRKSRSDGANIFLACRGGANPGDDDCTPWSNSGTLSSAGSEERFRPHHLIDDSLLEDPFTNPVNEVKSNEALMLPTKLSEKVRLAEGNPPRARHESQLGWGTECIFQGCVKRKTLIKEGRRPTVCSWQRYWLQIWGSALVLFSPKTLTKGTERKDFRSDPAKFTSISGWIVMVADTTSDNLSFQLTDPFHKSVYRFRAPTPELARTWVHYLHLSTKGIEADALPQNLISFE